MHWFMFDQFVVDIGAMGAPHIGVFYGGVRFRPVRFGNVLPFVGGVSNAILGANPDPDSTADTPPSGRVGPRLGVDIELSGRRLLLGLEADLFYNLSGDGFIFGDEGNWQPFGGLYLAYQI